MLGAAGLVLPRMAASRAEASALSGGLANAASAAPAALAAAAAGLSPSTATSTSEITAAGVALLLRNGAGEK